MHFIEAPSGLKWHYDLEGEGAPLLFIHGWGVDRRIWRQQTKYFSRFFKVLCIDLPGHGKSAWQKTSLQEMAKDIQHIFEQLGFQEVSIIGSSMGGLVALKIFDVCPEKIKSIVFVGSQPKFVMSDDYPFGLALERVRKLSDQVEKDYPVIINIFFRSLFTKSERKTRRYKWIQKFRRVDVFPEKEAMLAYLHILENADLRHVLDKVTLPVQFINGTEDYICPVKSFDYLKDRVPDARFDCFEHCGHFPFLSKPHEFNEVLGQFLLSLRGTK